MMKSGPEPTLDLTNLRFTVFSSSDIRKMSVTKIVTSTVFDALGQPLPGGLYDSAMGPYCLSADPCKTCGNRYARDCPGHSGHIDLCQLVYNPVFIQTSYQILKMSCLSCYRFQVKDKNSAILQLQLRLIDMGYLTEAQELEAFKCDLSEIGTEFYSGKEKEDYQAKKIGEYEKLLIEEHPSYVYNTKNTEALRASIVNTTIRVATHKACMHCREPMKTVKKSYGKLVLSVTKAEMQSFYDNQDDDVQDKSKVKQTNAAIFADECRQFLRQIYEVNKDCFALLFPALKFCSPNMEVPVDAFFTDVVPVSPNTVRMANTMNGQIIEHPQTSLYKLIVESNSTLKAIITNMKLSEGSLDTSTLNELVVNRSKVVYDAAEGSTSYEKMYNAWQTLQSHVDQTWDMNLGKVPAGQGLKQVIEKKEGIIRMHMMGKRVNFACRTVITPDPYIDVDEIGIPDVFAKKLSYPVPVTVWNAAHLRKLVMNGPDIYPGANLITQSNGFTNIIPSGPEKATEREGMAKLLISDKYTDNKIVHRHLVNGDVLLLNRQPSLHRNSIMAHKARILKGEKTFRLHYSNCKSYNADFDGDEMNAHCPQNELGRSEGYNLANVSSQYLVPKDGTPLGGLIQDNVIAGVKLSLRGRFFNREDYQHLVFAGLGHVQSDLILLPPAIMKPKRLWSGKQIFSTILLNIVPKGKAAINLISKAKIPAKAWQKAAPREWLAGGTPLCDNNMSEAEVIIRSGELMVGVMDKTHYGATPYGLIHSMYELYGGTCSTQLLSSFAKMFTIFLQREGFTLGVHDILVLPNADKKRKKIIRKSRLIGKEVLAAALAVPVTTPETELNEKMEEAYIRDPKFRTILDRQYKSALDGYTNSINKTCLPAGLLCKFPENNLQLMVGSGAKGSTVNTMQISCLLGQIELEGKRPPLMISGKTLPSFLATETSPKSGGFIDGRFLTGIQPQDFFFHCMAGREGLIDTAVKTSRSGYLQRCLIKHLEGLNVNYDLTVRDSDNSVIQFMYGEDGLDIAKAPFLRPAHLSFLDDNAKVIINDELLQNLQNDDEINEKMLHYKKKLKSWTKKHRVAATASSHKQVSSFQQFSAEIRDQIEVENPEKRSKKTGRRKIDQEIVKLWLNADDDVQKGYSKKCLKCPDPVVSKFKPDKFYGSLSEYFEKLISTYVKEHPHRQREFTDIMCVKSMRSFAVPGEPVGLLAAQSIGEPSTQMTLNTFHFAGRGEMNVTLGIPRLREILMMASANIKTPSMDIPFIKQPNIEAKAERLRLKLNRVTVSDVLESVNVQTYMILRPAREKVFKLRFKFLPHECYKDDYGVKPQRILRHMEKNFFKLMFKAIFRSMKQKNSIIDTDSKKEKNKAAQEQDFENDDIDEREPANTKKKSTAIDDSSDDEPANDDDDATAVKLKSKNSDENDYDAPEEREEIDDANSETEEQDAADGDASSDENEMEPSNVIKEHQYANNYIIDKENYLWCELTFHLPMQFNRNIDLTNILKDVAKKSIISEVPLINRAITYTQNDDLVLKTDGINIVEMFQHNVLLDLNRLYTNHIHAMAKTYGIEAAARVIVKEVQNVFNVYGITVDPRHLLLIADYMTFDGTFKPLSRRGMESSASPLQQMTFESSLHFLQSATISSRCENLESPSGRLMVGKPCKSGTGAMSLLNATPIDYLLRNIKK